MGNGERTIISKGFLSLKRYNILQDSRRWGRTETIGSLNCPKRLGLLLLVYSFRFQILILIFFPSCASGVNGGTTQAGFTMVVLQETGRHKH